MPRRFAWSGRDPGSRRYHSGVIGTGNPRELLRVAIAARTSGDGDAARVAYVRAHDAARSAGDVEAMTEAAVGLAAGRLFGTVPGQSPPSSTRTTSGRPGSFGPKRRSRWPAQRDVEVMRRASARAGVLDSR